MKKPLFLILFISSSFFIACDKQSPDSPTEDKEVKKYDVRFSTSAFTQGGTTMSNKSAFMSTTGTNVSSVGDSLKKHAARFYYRVYNSSGTLINSVDQDSSKVNFGTIDEQLPSGTYNVVFTASNGYLYGSDESSSYTNSYLAPSSAWEDTFTAKIQLKVGTENVTQPVKLERWVGALEVTLEDAIPANATRIAILYNNDAWGYQFNYEYTNNNGVRRKDFDLTLADKGLKNKKFFMYIGNTTEMAFVTIRAYADNRVISEKVVPNVRCYKSQKTLLAGNLFDSGSVISSGFNITINPVWTAPGAPINF